MSDYTRLSIWENNPDCMSWYDHAVGRKTPSEPFVTLSLGMSENIEREPVWENDDDSEQLAYQDAWFNELKAQDRKKKSTRRSRDSATPGISARGGHINKVAPTVPAEPYFEYLFADAELEARSGRSGNSIDDLSFGKQSQNESITDEPDLELADFPSPPVSQPSTPEPQLYEPQIISVACLNDDRYPQAQPSIDADVLRAERLAILEVGFDSGYTNEEGKRCSSEEANIRFFSEVAIPKTYSSAQPPNLSTISELANTRDKAVEVGNHLGRIEPQSHDTALKRNVLSLSTDIIHGRQRLVLRPKSQKTQNQTQAIGSKKNGSFTGHADRRVMKHRFNPPKTAGKRAAEESTNDNAVARNHIVHSNNKRPCLLIKEDDVSDELKHRLNSIIRESTQSCRTSSRYASSDFFSHKPLVIAPKGYVGQFDGMVIKPSRVADFKFNLTPKDMMRPDAHLTFGDPRHPNGLFTHNAIATDPLACTPDFTKENLPDGHPLFTCMNFATDMTIAACDNNVVRLRGYDEEILRRESHIECAHARLEGVAVGYYRYFQGHLSIEEYHDAEMCIC